MLEFVDQLEDQKLVLLFLQRDLGSLNEHKERVVFVQHLQSQFVIDLAHLFNELESKIERLLVL